DETAGLCNFILPDHHFLEAWGDYSPEPGVTDLVQPAMRPVFNTKQVGDVLLAVARELGTDIGGGASTFYDYLRVNWAGVAAGTEAWRDAIRRGGSFAAGGATAGAAGLPAAGAAAGAGLVSQ